MVESTKRELQEIIDTTKVSIALIGSTGAIGREFVDAAKENPHIEELFLICRKPLDEWLNMKTNGPKVTIIEKETFDDFSDIREQLEGKVDSFICTLGTQ